MVAPKSLVSFCSLTLGVHRMSYLIKNISAATLTVAALATFAPTGFASAADLAVKAKPVADQPFFFVIDNRATYSWMPNGTDPGAFSVRPNGSIDGTTSKSV